MYLTTPLTVIIFGASTLATFVSELNTREDLDPNLPKCGVEVWLGGADLQKARAQSQGFLKDFGAQVFSYTGPGGHVGRKEVTENSCKEGENCDRSFGPKASLDYWKDDENVGDFVLGTWKNTDDTVCNENGFGENCLPFIATPKFEANMTDNPACTEGSRRPFPVGKQGYWWRCQLECKKKK